MAGVFAMFSMSFISYVYYKACQSFKDDHHDTLLSMMSLLQRHLPSPPLPTPPPASDVDELVITVYYGRTTSKEKHDLSLRYPYVTTTDNLVSSLWSVIMEKDEIVAYKLDFDVNLHLPANQRSLSVICLRGTITSMIRGLYSVSVCNKNEDDDDDFQTQCYINNKLAWDLNYIMIDDENPNITIELFSKNVDVWFYRL
jgi:hypothetical protein